MSLHINHISTTDLWLIIFLYLQSQWSAVCKLIHTNFINIYIMISRHLAFPVSQWLYVDYYSEHINFMKVPKLYFYNLFLNTQCSSKMCIKPLIPNSEMLGNLEFLILWKRKAKTFAMFQYIQFHPFKYTGGLFWVWVGWC